MISAPHPACARNQIAHGQPKSPRWARGVLYLVACRHGATLRRAAQPLVVGPKPVPGRVASPGTLAVLAQVVERRPSKSDVAGSMPAYRTNHCAACLSLPPLGAGRAVSYER